MATAGAAAAAALTAMSAAGVVVRLAPEEFLRLALRETDPLIIHASGGLWKTTHRYLTSHRGLAFFTESPAPLTLPAGSEVVHAKSIWVPG